jgi:hypothetical protein
VHKVIIHFAVAAHEYSNVVGERFLADDSFFIVRVIIYCIDRGLRTTSRQISFEFLFIKTCPPDKLHNGFGFVIQFRVGIRYLKCEGGEF